MSTTEIQRSLCFEPDSFNVPLREDLMSSFKAAWEHLARPGSGWSGVERIAIARETRRAADCDLCKLRKTALSPYGVEGTHDRDSELPGSAVDAVHRITTDPGRLTESWFRDLLGSGLTETQYVEIIGIVGTVISIDTFCRAIGRELEPLPSPLPGEPTGYRPKRLKRGGLWLPILMESDLREREADIYRGERSGANVLRCLSLVPDEVRNLQQICDAMYLSSRQVRDVNSNGGRALSRPQIELVASRVSALNECFY